MKTTDLSNFIFQLTNSAIEMRPDAHQASQIALLKEVVPFDAAWWGWSNFSGGRNRLNNTGLYDLPSSFESAVRAVLHLDPFVQSGRNLAVYGKTVDVEADDLPRDYRQCLRAFDIKSILNGHCRLQGDTQFNFFLSLYKRTGGDRFSDADSRDFRVILKHIEQNLSLSLRAELRSLAPKDGEAAIVSEGGAIVRATRDFQDRLAQECRTVAHSAKVLSDMSFGQLRWASASVVLEGALYKPGLRLIRLAPSSALARLSRHEREVADDLSQGLTMREIAAKRDVSHNTVRNQVASIYRKTGVTNRALFMAKMDLR